MLCERTVDWLNKQKSVCTPPEPQYARHLCPIYYHEKNSGSFANSKPLLLWQLHRWTTKHFQGCFSLKMGAIMLSNLKHPQFQYFFLCLINSSSLNTKIFTWGCSFQNYTHLKIPKVQLKIQFVRGGHIYQ